MNKCFFLGKVLSNFEFEEFSKTCRIIFYLNIEEKRKTKSGKSKIMNNTLAFEAWDTAATAIRDNIQEDDTMVIEACARTHSGYPHDETFFRVTNFKILPND